MAQIQRYIVRDSLDRELSLRRVTAVQNANCYICEEAFTDVGTDAYTVLSEQLPWSQGKVRVRGATWDERRLTCLMSDEPGKTYHYAGKEMAALSWHEIVGAIRDRVMLICEVSYPGWRSDWRFDTCLCNYYRPKAEIPVAIDPETGAEKPWKPDIISWHADSEQDLVPNSPIASVSFGATRRFDLRANKETSGLHIRAPIQHEDVQTYLTSGTLFIMGENTQHHYIHQVPEERKITGGRVNLTFRMTKK